MSYLRIEEDGEQNEQQSEPGQEDLMQVEQGTLSLIRYYNGHFERAVVNLLEAEGEEEEDEYELGWERI